MSERSPHRELLRGKPVDPAAWRDYRVRVGVLVFGLFGFLPLVGVGQWLLGPLIGLTSMGFLIIVPLFFFMVWAWLRFISWPCPRCGQAFHEELDQSTGHRYLRPFANRCHYCGLERFGGRGYCAVCGYDLRESRDRCPECGTPLPEKETMA